MFTVNFQHSAVDDWELWTEMMMLTSPWVFSQAFRHLRNPRDFSHSASASNNFALTPYY
jgi:hypothetical protein